METLEKKFAAMLNTETAKQFETYFQMLVQANEKFNLTAITAREEVYSKHFADSIAAADVAEGDVLDVGAGAGFPSVPLKIVKPSLRVTMADSLQKRVFFLNDVIAALQLKDIRAMHVRAEDMKKDKLYDCAVARAVASLPTLCEYLLPFVKVGGKMIAYKAKGAAEEIQAAKNAIRLLGGGNARLYEMRLNEQTERALVVVEKIAPCPAKYPRGGNKPKTQPL